MELDARNPGLVDLPPAASRRWLQGAGLPSAAAAVLAGLGVRNLAAMVAIVLLIALLATAPAL